MHSLGSSTRSSRNSLTSPSSTARATTSPERDPARSPEAGPSQIQSHLGLDVARDSERGVRGMIEAAKEIVNSRRGGRHSDPRSRRLSSSDTGDPAERVQQQSPWPPSRTAGSRSSGAARSARRRAGSRTSLRSMPEADTPSGPIPSTAPARGRWMARPPNSWCGRRWSTR